MFHRLMLMSVVGVLCACDAPPQAPAPSAEPPARRAALTDQQLKERSDTCGARARADFDREGKKSEGAIYAHHYNTKLDTCFYLLTVSRQAAGSVAVLNRKLIDITEGELYGEYQGPPDAGEPLQAFPETCKLAGLYCASEREWEVLVRFFMEG